MKRRLSFVGLCCLLPGMVSRPSGVAAASLDARAAVPASPLPLRLPLSSARAFVLPAIGSPADRLDTLLKTAFPFGGVASVEEKEARSVVALLVRPDFPSEVLDHPTLLNWNGADVANLHEALWKMKRDGDGHADRSFQDAENLLRGVAAFDGDAARLPLRRPFEAPAAAGNSAEIARRIERGLSHFRNSQRADGRWDALPHGDSFWRNAVAVLVYHRLGRLEEKRETVRGLMDFLWVRQDPGTGGFSAVGEPARDLNTLVYRAARAAAPITAEPVDSPRMARLAAAIPERDVRDDGSVLRKWLSFAEIPARAWDAGRADVALSAVQAMEESMAPAGPGLVALSPGRAPLRETAGVVQALVEIGVSPFHPMIAAAEAFLWRSQSVETGAFGAGDPSRRPFDFDETVAAGTALARVAAARGGAARADVYPRLRRALDLIVDSQETGGGFGPDDERTARAAVLLAFFRPHSPKISRSHRKAIRSLLTWRGADGWSSESSVDPLAGTAWALDALSTAFHDRYLAEAVAPVLEDGLEFLLSRQRSGHFSESPARTGAITALLLEIARRTGDAYEGSVGYAAARAVEFLLRTQRANGLWQDNAWTARRGTERVIYPHLQEMAPLHALGSFLRAGEGWK